MQSQSTPLGSESRSLAALIALKPTRAYRRKIGQRCRDPLAAPRIVIVTRLSKSGRDDMSHRTQEASCRRKADAIGGEVVAVFHDDDVSGDRLQRVGLDAALTLIAKGDADILLCHSVDRMSRDMNALAVIARRVQTAGGRLMSATEDLTSGALGDFLGSAVALAGALELEKIRERTGRAFEARFHDAKRYKPGQRIPYGYRKGDPGEGEFAINPVEAATLRRIFAWAEAGWSQTKIAETLTANEIPNPSGRGTNWSTQTIGALLQREVYWTGKHECWRTRTIRRPENDNKPEPEVRPESDRYFVTMPILIDAGIAQAAAAARARMQWKTRRPDRAESVGILRYGFAACAGCGRALVVGTNGETGWQRYRCPNADCQAPASKGLGLLDAAIVAEVGKIALDPVRAASHFVAIEERRTLDTVLLERLAAAERVVTEQTAALRAQIKAFAKLSGPAANIAQDELDAASKELAKHQAERDRLAKEAAKQARPVRKVKRRVSPETAIGQAVDAALAAGWDAYRRTRGAELQGAFDADPEMYERYGGIDEEMYVDYRTAQGERYVELPEHNSASGWAAWQAILSVLNVHVVLRQEDSDAARWELTLTVPGGGMVAAADSANRASTTCR